MDCIMITEQKTGVWIDWTGGFYPPVPQGAEFLYILRGTPSVVHSSKNSFELEWRHNGTILPNAQIIAYMIVPKFKPKEHIGRWSIVKRTQPIGHGFTMEYRTDYAINDRTSTKLGNLQATTDGEYALIERFVKLLNEVAP